MDKGEWRRLLTTIVGGLSAFGLSVAAEQQAPRASAVKTTPEATEFKSTSTYDDVVRFMKAMDEASKDVYYTTYGTTFEGRPMPMAVVATGVKDPGPTAIRRTGKLRVHIQGNIHAGEVEGKEAAQVLLRELASGQHADWLRSTVFLITPIFNADGNEKFSLNNRQRQNGPINGMGTRPNAQGLNLNRDFMKLETPEDQAFAKLWVDYDPHVGFDLHTSNGSYHAYHLTYSPPLNPNTSEQIVKLMKDEWFPFITKNIREKHNWHTFYYGNAAQPGGRGRGRGGPGAGTPPGAPGAGAAAPGTGAPPVPAGAARGDVPPSAQQPQGPRAWYTFEHVPRFHNNYVGLRNRFALLSEAYSYATFEDRIKVTKYFLDEALAFGHQNAGRLKKTIEAADKEPVVGTTLATRGKIKQGGMVEILMGEVEEEKNPVSGAVMYRRKDVVRPEQMTDMMWFEPAGTETAPAEYYVPAHATKVLELLKRHGVQVREVKQPVKAVEQFAIESNAAGQTFEGHALRRLEGAWQPSADAVVPVGSWAVPMNQPLARLAFYLLEPASDDGVVTWNALDEELKDAKVYPILRKR